MTRRTHIGRRRVALLATVALAPVVAAGSLTAVALAQPAPGDGPVPSAAFMFGQQAATDLAAAKLWAGETDAVALSRDSTRRDLVRLMRSVLRLPGGATGSQWRDIAPDDADGVTARYVMAKGWLPAATAGAAALDQQLTGAEANRAWTLGLGMNRAIKVMSRFRDDAGRRFTLPPGFATAITAREAGLRRNYPASDEALERTDAQPLRLADLVLMASRARAIRGNGIPSSVRSLERFSIPAVDPAVAPLIQRALSLVGYPYVWGGEATDLNAGADPQAAAGFDCSGFVYWVWHNGDRSAEASLNVPDGRTTYTMNVGTKGVKVPWKKAVAANLVFFGSRGPKTPDAEASHTSIALGNKWIIHSSGGRAGVSISYLPTYWPAGIQDARDYRAAAGSPVTATPVTTTPTTSAPAPVQAPTAPAPQAPQAPPASGGAQPPPPTP
jgi:cell wall-associated NlpC family hydrolase